MEGVEGVTDGERILGIQILCFQLSMAEDCFMDFMYDEAWLYLTPVLCCISYLPQKIQLRAHFLADSLEEEEDYYYG